MKLMFELSDGVSHGRATMEQEIELNHQPHQRRAEIVPPAGGARMRGKRTRMGVSSAPWRDLMTACGKESSSASAGPRQEPSSVAVRLSP